MQNRKIFILIAFFVAIIGALLFKDCQAQEFSRSSLIPKQQNKISLDIKGMDIVDVLKMLAQRTGMNIIVGKGVTGKVTLFLKEVNIEDAFEIIILSNDLAYEKKGDIINVMTQRDFELQNGQRFQDKKQARIIQLKHAKAADLARALNQIKTNVGKVVADENSNTLTLIDTPEKLEEMSEFVKATDLALETRVFDLNYAQADKLSTKIQEAVTKGVGSLKIDERTNKIAVTDYPSRLEDISKVVKAFDEKTPQVLIDAQIIEIKPSDKFEMGVDWDYWLEKNFRLASSLPSSGTLNKISIGTAARGAVAGEQGEYKSIIDLLRTIGDTKILSSPRIMALNNQEAKILVGTKDAYITSTTSQGTGSTTVTSQEVNFVDVGIKLYVTPTINRVGFVTMKIKPEVSSAVRTELTAEGKVTQVPIVTTSESETTVMVKDGVTLIIGGLKKESREKTVKKVPLVGDVPLLGKLFSSTSDNLTSTELIILLTPHIMSGEDSFTDFADIKPKDGAVLKMVKGDIVTERTKASSGRAQKITTIPEYYAMLSNRVMSFATAKATGEQGIVQVAFTLNAQGQLQDEPRIVYYTNPNLYDLTIESVKMSSPFPAFPRDLDREQEVFSVTVEYR